MIEPIGAVYILIDPRDNMPFYVGCSTNPKQRYKTHIYSRNRPEPNNVGLTPTQQRIGAICNDGFKPIMEIVELVDSYHQSRYVEDRWMRQLAHRGYALTNVFTVMGLFGHFEKFSSQEYQKLGY